MTQRQFAAGVVGGVALVGLLAYANVFQNEFVWDDASTIQLNEHIRSVSYFPQLFREDLHAFGRGQGNFYRPLQAASYMLDYALAGGPAEVRGPAEVSSFMFHLSSILWHILASAFLALLLIRLEAPRFVSAAVPLIYVAHPLHTEAVTYISGRADSMAATFMFAGLWVSAGPTRILFRALMVSLIFAAALLSKESAAVFPALLLTVLVTARRQEGESLRARFLPLALSVGIVAIYGLLRATALRFGADSGNIVLPLARRITETGQAFALYIKLIFAPTNLHMERSLEGVPAFISIGGWALIAACAAAAFWSYRAGKTRAAMGLAWFLLTWFPVSGLIPLNAPMAEHWLYVPLAGFLIAIAEWGAPFLTHPLPHRGAAVLVYAILLIFVAMCLDRNRDWRNNETLYRATLEQNPDTIRVNFNLAVTYEDLTGNPAGARRHYERVIALRDRERQTAGAHTAAKYYADELEAHLFLGNLNFQNGAIDQAARHYDAVVNVSPTESTQNTIAGAALGLGRCFLAIGRPEQAAQLLEFAGRLQPELKSDIDTALGAINRGRPPQENTAAPPE